MRVLASSCAVLFVLASGEGRAQPPDAPSASVPDIVPDVVPDAGEGPARDAPSARVEGRVLVVRDAAGGERRVELPCEGEGAVVAGRHAYFLCSSYNVARIALDARDRVAWLTTALPVRELRATQGVPWVVSADGVARPLARVLRPPPPPPPIRWGRADPVQHGFGIGLAILGGVVAAGGVVGIFVHLVAPQIGGFEPHWLLPGLAGLALGLAGLAGGVVLVRDGGRRVQVSLQGAGLSLEATL